MLNSTKFTILIAILSPVIFINVYCACGDWATFHGRCFKSMERVGTMLEAEELCGIVHGSLIVIHNKDEQDFVYNLLKKQSTVAPNAWIGIVYADNKFVWVDNSAMDYTHWAYGNPHPRSDQRFCVQMSLANPTSSQWVDEPCNRKSMIACQKSATTVISGDLETRVKNLATRVHDLELNLELTIKKHHDDIKIIADELIVEREAIRSLGKYAVPVGFIYIQLPKQPDPSHLWTHASWEDITDLYAGLFFRVLGKGTGAFGKIQEANYSRIEYIRTKTYVGLPNKKKTNPHQYHLAPGKWIASNHLPDASILHNIYTTTGENRPRNTAIKIWKCI